MAETPEQIIARTDAHLAEWGTLTAELCWPLTMAERAQLLRECRIRADRERLLAEVWD